MTLLHVIHPDGRVDSEEYAGPLEFAAPPFSFIKRALGNGRMHLEHVSVLWKGRPAHMFVDEDGWAHHLPVNRRATLIYANVTLSRVGLPLYEDLELPIELVRSRLAANGFGGVILGTTALWEGGLE